MSKSSKKVHFTSSEDNVVLTSIRHNSQPDTSEPLLRENMQLNSHRVSLPIIKKLVLENDDGGVYTGPSKKS